MTTKEFLIKKNEIVKKVTGVVLTPENQIVDEPKVKLDDDYFEYLISSTCPYCMNRKNGEFCPCDCDTCPMYLAGNYCLNENSTWLKANKIWRQKATNKNKYEFKLLVLEYNKDIEGLENDNKRVFNKKK